MWSMPRKSQGKASVNKPSTAASSRDMHDAFFHVVLLNTSNPIYFNGSPLSKIKSGSNPLNKTDQFNHILTGFAFRVINLDFYPFLIFKILIFDAFLTLFLEIFSECLISTFVRT